jgi:hypothetical protein
MKKIKLYFAIALCFLASTGCDQGFDDLNTNRIAPTTLNPLFLLNTAIINSSFPGGNLVFELAIVQQMVSPNSGVLAGGNFNQENRTVSIANWTKYYRDVLKLTIDAQRLVEGNNERSNLLHMSRILSSHAFLILTDTYGDIPYREAGLGFISGNVSPVYDTQEEVYRGILTTLEQACSGLDASRQIETGDVLYGGDVVKWRKFGYSLMLRAAMRLTKANTALAQEFVTKAVNGGLMQSNADNAMIRHDFNFAYAIGNTLNATEANNYYLAAPFVDFLKNSNDPRLASIAVRYKGARSGPDQNNTIAGNPPAGVSLSRDPADQIGMPMGYDNATIVPIAQQLNLASFYDFSQLDRTRMGKRDAPVFFVTYAQTQLLLAEAITRGWATGSAAQAFSNGVRGHMEQLAAFGENTTVPEDDIAAYLQDNPLDPATALRQINEQYWVASIMNGPETFANFRRSGFPALAPNPFPGREIASEDFIRRLNYPDDERSVNLTNLQQAISRQGADRLDTRVWWDRP